MRSMVVYLYPHSLSYQETSLTKLSFRAIPALASKMLDLEFDLIMNKILYRLFKNNYTVKSFHSELKNLQGGQF